MEMGMVRNIMIKNKHITVVVSVFALTLILFPAVSALELSNNPDIDSEKDFNSESGNNSMLPIEGSRELEDFNSEPENNSMLPIEYFSGFHERNNHFGIRLPSGEIFPYLYTGSFNIYEENLSFSVVHNEKRVTQKSNLTQHEPIWIDGDNNFTSENGVTNGTGTIEDPYIIEGWEIKRRLDTSMGMCAGIVIKNSSKHVVIRNLYIINPMFDYGGGWWWYASGVILYNVSNCSIQNITVEAQGNPSTWMPYPFHYGIWIEESDNMFLENNTIINYGQGMVFSYTCDVVLRNNSFNSNLHSLFISGNQTMHYVFDIDSSNTVNGKKIVYLTGEKNLFFDNSSDFGFLAMVSCINVTVRNFTDCELIIANTTNADVMDSDISSINVCLSFNISVTNITVHDALFGAWFVDNENSSFLNSTVYNATFGVFSNVDYMLIKNLTTHSTAVGVDLRGYNQRIENSTINAFNSGGIWIGGGNNTVDNTTVLGGGNTAFGIILFKTSGNIITNCIIAEFWWTGISLQYAYNNTIANCNITGVVGYGIEMSVVNNNNTIVNCNITECWFGVLLMGVNSNNTIVGNTFYNNRYYGTAYGVYISYRDWYGNIVGYSNNSLIYHNNFIGNDHNAYDDCYNFWDYDSEGNYWDDYAGVDEDCDGIGDTPYAIPGGSNYDNYPLMHEFTWWDKDEPEILLISPENNSVIKPCTIITFDVTDENLRSVNYSINNGAAQLFSTEYEINTTNWEDGIYNILIYAKDWGDNTNSKSFTFTIDSILPIISLLSPSNNSLIQLGTVIDLDISDINIDTVTYTLNDGEQQILHSPYDVYTWGWNDGIYKITISASDLAGNEISKWFVFTVDGTPPSILLISPANNSVIRPGTIIDFNVSDAHLDDVSYSINDGEIQLFSSPYNIDTTDWNDGIYKITVYASDLVNNEIYRLFTFAIDGTKPNISLIYPENNSVIKPGTVIDFEINDIHLNITTYTLNDGLPETLSSPYDINTWDWEDGTCNITIFANDLAGNEISKMFTFTIDSVVPEILLIYPSNNSLIQPGTILDFDIRDSHLKSSVYSLHDYPIDMTLVAARYPFNYPYNISTIGWSDKTRAVEIYANDTAGNEISRWFVFTIDGTPPTVIIVESSQTTSKSSFTISWSASEDVQYYEVSTDGINWENVSKNTQHTFTLSKGANTLYVRGTDFAGNTGTNMITVTYKKEEPKGFIPSFELIYLISTICLALALKRRKRI